MFKFLVFLVSLPRFLICKLIEIYQKTFSLDHGPKKENYPFGYCKFTPTCSEYAYDAIKKYGIIWGGIKSLWRIIRCNPLSRGGYDPVK